MTPEEERQVKDGATAQRALARVQYLQDTYNIEKEWREKNRQERWRCDSCRNRVHPFLKSCRS